MQYGDMKKRLAVGVLFGLGIVAFPLQAGGIVPPDGLSQATADGLYVNETGDTGMTGMHDYTIAILMAADAAAAGHVVTRGFGDGRYPQLAVANAFTQANTFSFAGLPLTATNTTGIGDLELFKLYHAPGPGNGDSGDSMLILYQFDDESTTSIPWIEAVEGTDLDAKGGTFGSKVFRSGSVSPIDVFRLEGNTAPLGPKANFYGLLLDSDTGMTGGANLIQWKIGNITHLALVGGGTDQLQLGVGYDFLVNDNVSIEDKLAVGLTVSSMDASVRFQVGGTLLGSLPAPLVTSAQRLAIAGGTPTDGAQADDSDLSALFRYNGPAAAWEKFSMDVPTIKSGTVPGATFVGNPKIFTVTFGTAFLDTNYSVTITAEDNRTFTFQTKLAASFVMNSNANLALVGDVDWTATAHNDP